LPVLEQTWPRTAVADLLGWLVRQMLYPLQALITLPSHFFILTLALMLFHPPGLAMLPYDRIAFGLLGAIVLLRIFVHRERLRFGGPVTWPLLGLTVLAFAAARAQPYTAEVWSVYAAKWLVPFTLFQLAGYAFTEDADFRRFEVFSLTVLIYLCFIAIVFVLGMKSLIFPRFILDESLGIHADRARGPFLQAVANGVALNLLGLVALDSYRRKRLRGVFAVILLASIPLAILATKTRAVWLSFAASIVALCFFSPNRRIRRASLCLLLCSLIAMAGFLAYSDHHRSISERLEENGPVKFRMAVYQAGWEMFLAQPLFGWNARSMQAELYRRISDFRQEEYYFHNTYLEILVQYGLPGLALYVWVIVDLFRIGRRSPSRLSANNLFLDRGFRSLWPLIVLVYLVNASFVVMNYQFVNGFLFTLAGMINTQNRRLEAHAG
jgi:putative inorganic carbon (hco3(-)) transporter